MTDVDISDVVSDKKVSQHLLIQFYNELRALAARKLMHERVGHTLQPTALLHEAYFRIAGQVNWNSNEHFMAAASEAMRRILVENARRKNSIKRGSGWQRQTGELERIEANRPSEEILAVHDALEVLEQENQLAAEVVKLRYFGGLTIEETAQALEISTSSVNRNWFYARAKLRLEISNRPVADERF